MTPRRMVPREAITLYLNGHTTREVGHQLGHSANTIWHALVRWGVPMRDDRYGGPGRAPRRLDPNELRYVTTARERGLSWATIGYTLGIDRMTVQRAWERQTL